MKTLLSAVAGVTFAWAILAASAEWTPGAREVSLEIESATLADALDQWAQQSGYQIVARNWEIAQKLTAPKLKGKFRAEDALEKLLSDTPLTHRWLSEAAVAIRLRAEPTSSSQESAQQPPLRLAQLSDDGERRRNALVEAPAARAESLALFGEVEEMIVTGSHIRGGSIASPLVTIDRQDIDRSGIATVQQLLRVLPQNFGGGISENSGGGFEAAPGGSFTHGTGVNLRGLGTGATLVLLNGQRLAPTGFGEFVDVSGFPLSAIERIDVLTDGASAIYGSDAVAGVVNIILRDNYNGAETTARYGAVTSGSSDELQVGQTLGKTWSTGHSLATYEYYDRSHLDADDRKFTRAAPDPLYLLPDQKRHSAILSLSQDLGKRTRLSGSGHYSRRTYRSMSNAAGALPEYDEGYVEQGGGMVGLQVDMTPEWQLAFDAAASRATARNRSFALPSPVPFADGRTRFEVLSLDSRLDGPVLDAPGGKVRLAAGGGIRTEKYTDRPNVAEPTEFLADRDVSSAYAELLIPIVGNGNSRSGIRHLELGAAARHERYSDFGSATKPKFGVSWGVTDLVSVRGTYGKSFHAPSFEQLRGGGVGSILLVPFPDSEPPGETPTIFFQGGNSALKAETSAMWTVGADVKLRPASLAIGLTYFDIDYDNRIEAPPGGLINALFNDDLLGPYVVRNPSPTLVQSIASEPDFLNFLDLPLSSVGAIVDFRLHNSAISRLKGFDAGITYDREVAVGKLALELNAQYLLESDQQVIAGAEVADILDTVFNPLRFKARGSASWTIGRLSTTAIVNYMGSYSDLRTTPADTVDSWTTVDANIRYELGGFLQGVLSGTAVSLSILNAFDTEPPFVRDLSNQVNFDGANASALGRFVALQVVTRW